MSRPKVALVHDYLQEFGGAERVLWAMHLAFPQAPVYTAFADLSHFGVASDDFAQLDKKYTFIQKIPLHQRLRSPLRIVTPAAFRHLDLSGYDVVISSTNSYHAKSITVSPHAVHLCYCHTPARSLYGYDTRSHWRENSFFRLGGEVANYFLRLEDFTAAQCVDQILVNSATVASRVEKFWHRPSTILYPPVAMVDAFSSSGAWRDEDRSYLLYVNRLNAAKHPELAIKAAIRLHLPLKIVGTGPAEAELRVLAAGEEGIEFCGNVSDKQLEKLYVHAQALLYPAVDEDFGIVPVEAMSAGTPVIAHHSGGPTETIIDGVTGIFFDDLSTEDDLIKAIRKSTRINWQRHRLHEHTRQFSQANFIKRLQEIVTETYAKKR